MNAYFGSGSGLRNEKTDSVVNQTDRAPRFDESPLLTLPLGSKCVFPTWHFQLTHLTPKTSLSACKTIPLVYSCLRKDFTTHLFLLATNFQVMFKLQLVVNIHIYKQIYYSLTLIKSSTNITELEKYNSFFLKKEQAPLQSYFILLLSFSSWIHISFPGPQQNFNLNIFSCLKIFYWSLYHASLQMNYVYNWYLKI